ncbi:exodeoxyribonuclease III [Rhodococcus sp. ABRD24]|uniref:exodeoxyribonuclease III n=1 Tax=Rhodococcus sp. ABRD24 TaxID=2507582 RepID=UPI00103ACC1E|nr:exodeoxyribonuclease III [Rhodococcus sp. ABRD24]QBJ95425.1 exodeoxyribonuclease III [Rhodococcus sp. ABRD24]
MPHIITTVNVNGVRAAARKGLLEWIEGSQADVVCLQETRASDKQLHETLAPAVDTGWHLASAEPSAKGRNGVAVLSRRPADAVRIGFGDDEFADAGRYIEADFDAVTVGSLYLPTGEAETPKQAEKERFMASFAAHLARSAESTAAAGREMVVCGDWNIAHTERDIKNWKGNVKKSGFLPGERAWLDSLFADGAWTDVVRTLHPDVDGPYSWWSYRGKAFDTDAGWRIDYHLTTPGLAERAKESRVERADTYAERWSDHAPVTVQFR